MEVATMRKNMEKVSVKRLNKIDTAELVYDPIFFLENDKQFLQFKVSLFSQLTVVELISSKGVSLKK